MAKFRIIPMINGTEMFPHVHPAETIDADTLAEVVDIIEHWNNKDVNHKYRFGGETLDCVHVFRFNGVCHSRWATFNNSADFDEFVDRFRNG